jgi:hypothetical protein
MNAISVKNRDISITEDIVTIKLIEKITKEELYEISKTTEDLFRKFRNAKYIIVDLSLLKNVPLDARKRVAEYPSGQAEKLALICPNPVARMIGGFFLKTCKLPLPAEIFSDAGDAKKWFKQED